MKSREETEMKKGDRERSTLEIRKFGVSLSFIELFSMVAHCSGAQREQSTRHAV